MYSKIFSGATDENMYIIFSGTGDISCDFEGGDCVFSNSKTLTYDWIIKTVKYSLQMHTNLSPIYN
jgi:hypothetical protein